MNKTAVYLRCSTNEQNPEVQLNSIKKYCSIQGWEIKHTYVDEGISGSKDQRPKLDQLKIDIQKGRFNKVVVFRFDRLARSTSHLLECLHLFQRYGVDFISVTEGIDTTSSIGKMIFTFLGAIAEFERSLIQERIKAALTLKKEQGVKLGRPRIGFDVNTALELKRSGYSWKELSKKLNVTVSTLRRTLTPLLKNPIAS